MFAARDLLLCVSGDVRCVKLTSEPEVGERVRPGLCTCSRLPATDAPEEVTSVCFRKAAKQLLAK